MLTLGLCGMRWGISIHALHEESDQDVGKMWAQTVEFQSTLSMRRATDRVTAEFVHAIVISIHALHEESDLLRLAAAGLPLHHFNPRSP